MVHSLGKGHEYELHIAKEFSEWWYGKSFAGVRGDALPIRRTPMSGGFDHRSHPADLFCVEDPKGFPFSVECKKQESFSWWAVFKKVETTPLWDWWKQTIAEGKFLSQIPILCFAVNYSPDMLCTYQEFAVESLVEGVALSFTDVVLRKVVVLRLDSFFTKQTNDRNFWSQKRCTLHEK